MQTFLPYSDFTQSAECLDRLRLGKQRVETWQLITALTVGSRWQSHPAAKMWDGYIPALALYGLECSLAWIKRGYKDSLGERFATLIEGNENEILYPPWLGDTEFHASHRSNLLRKDFSFYSKYGWLEPNDLPYIWPSKKILAP